MIIREMKHTGTIFYEPARHVNVPCFMAARYVFFVEI